MRYPSLEEVNKATRYDICKWWRFCTPETDEQLVIMNRIAERLKELGGFTPEISKALGWDKR